MIDGRCLYIVHIQAENIQCNLQLVMPVRKIPFINIINLIFLENTKKYKRFYKNVMNSHIFIVFLVDLKVDGLTQPGEVDPKKRSIQKLSIQKKMLTQKWSTIKRSTHIKMQTITFDPKIRSSQMVDPKIMSNQNLDSKKSVDPYKNIALIKI